jgi:hypothetical protein
MSEVLTVSKASPVLLTQLSAYAIVVGGSDLDQTALLLGSPTAGGTVTYTVYTDSACTIGAQAAGTVMVTNGSVPNSNTVSFPTAGLYFWQAKYSGDGNNNAARSPCASEPLIVIPSAMDAKQAALNAMNGLIPTATGHDREFLQNGVDDLNGSLVASLWVDGNDIQGTASAAQTVFGDELKAVRNLMDMMNENGTKVPAATIETWIDEIVGADGVLAYTEYNAASAAGGNAMDLARSQAALLAGQTAWQLGGDQAAFTADFAAWYFAEASVGHVSLTSTGGAPELAEPKKNAENDNAQ